MAGPRDDLNKVTAGVTIDLELDSEDVIAEKVGTQAVLLAAFSGLSVDQATTWTARNIDAFALDPATNSLFMIDRNEREILMAIVRRDNGTLEIKANVQASTDGN